MVTKDGIAMKTTKLADEIRAVELSLASAGTSPHRIGLQIDQVLASCDRAIASGCKFIKLDADWLANAIRDAQLAQIAIGKAREAAS